MKHCYCHSLSLTFSLVLILAFAFLEQNFISMATDELTDCSYPYVRSFPVSSWLVLSCAALLTKMDVPFVTTMSWTDLIRREIRPRHSSDKERRDTVL